MFINKIHSDFKKAIPNPDGSIDSGIPWHFGDPFKEQKQIINSNTVTDTSNRKILIISGDDREKWLNDLTTKNIIKLMPKRQTDALILDSKGHIDFQFNITKTAEKIFLEIDHIFYQDLIDYLSKMVFWSKIELIETDFCSLQIFENECQIDLTKLDDLVVLQIDKKISKKLYTEKRNFNLLWNFFIENNFLPIGSNALEVSRIMKPYPRVYLDGDNKTFPEEMGLVSNDNSKAVDIGKGCYRGQESVSKIYNMGNPPRKFYRFLLDNPFNEDLSENQNITFKDKVIGHFGSFKEHYEMGLIGLGLLKYNADISNTFQIQNTSITLTVDSDSIPIEKHEAAGKQAIENWKNLKHTT